MDELLQSLGLNKDGLRYEDMNKDERATYMKWLTRLEEKQLTLSDVLSYIQQARNSVEAELVDTPETERSWLFFQRPNRKAILLRARLRNYMLLENMLTSPERARQAIEKALRQAN